MVLRYLFLSDGTIRRLDSIIIPGSVVVLSTVRSRQAVYYQILVHYKGKKEGSRYLHVNGREGRRCGDAEERRRTIIMIISIYRVHRTPLVHGVVGVQQQRARGAASGSGSGRGGGSGRERRGRGCGRQQRLARRAQVGQRARAPRHAPRLQGQQRADVGLQRVHADVVHATLPTRTPNLSFDIHEASIQLAMVNDDTHENVPIQIF